MARTIWVDFALGDSSTGDGSYAAPFAHLPLSAAFASAGGSYAYQTDDIWRLKRGTILDLSNTANAIVLTSAHQGLTITDYGDDLAAPSLYAYKELTAATWANAGGNVWTTTLSYNPLRVILDGVGALWSGTATPAAPDATNRWSYSGTTLSVYATSNPSTFYTSILVPSNTSASAAISVTDPNDITFENFDIEGWGGNAPTISFVIRNEHCKNISLDTVSVLGGSPKSAGIRFAGESPNGGTYSLPYSTTKARIGFVVAENLNIDKQYTVAGEDRYAGYGSSDGFALFTAVGYPGHNAVGEGVTLRNSNLAAFNHACLNITSTPKEAYGELRNILIDNVTMDGGHSSYCRGFGSAGKNNHNNILRRLKITNMNIRSQFQGRNNVFHSSVIDTTTLCSALYDGVALDAPTFTAGTLEQGLSIGGWDIGNENYAESVGLLVSNIVIKDTSLAGLRVHPTSGVTSYSRNVVQNVIIQNCGNDEARPRKAIDHDETFAAGLSGYLPSILRNIQIYNSGGVSPIEVAGTDAYANIAAAQTANPTIVFDCAEADPLLAIDYSIGVGSPCINAGAPMGSKFSTDYNGNYFDPASPDIGAVTSDSTFVPETNGQTVVNSEI